MGDTWPTGSYDKTAHVFEAAGGKEVAHMTLSEQVFAVNYADGSSITRALSRGPEVGFEEIAIHLLQAQVWPKSRVTEKLRTIIHFELAPRLTRDATFFCVSR